MKTVKLKWVFLGIALIYLLIPVAFWTGSKLSARTLEIGKCYTVDDLEFEEWEDHKYYVDKILEKGKKSYKTELYYVRNGGARYISLYKIRASLAYLYKEIECPEVTNADR